MTDSTCAKVDDHCSVITCKKVNVAAEEPVGLRQESKAEEAVAIRAMNEVAIRSFVGGRTISWPAAASPCCIRPDACTHACVHAEGWRTHRRHRLEQLFLRGCPDVGRNCSEALYPSIPTYINGSFFMF